MFVELFDHTDSVPEPYQKLVEDMIQFASEFMKYPSNRECSVTFMSNEEIREINRIYRNIDKETDVISFALDDQEDDMESIRLLSQRDDSFVTEIGDILISLERAKEQAKDYGHSVERELGFLALHGFLHLNGYDHQTLEEEAEMFGLQDQILTAYGLERK